MESEKMLVIAPGIDESVCEFDLGEVGKHAKQGIGREFMNGYRDRPDTW